MEPCTRKHRFGSDFVFKSKLESGPKIHEEQFGCSHYFYISIPMLGFLKVGSGYGIIAGPDPEEKIFNNGLFKNKVIVIFKSKHSVADSFGSRANLSVLSDSDPIFNICLQSNYLHT